jgi:hypothetical protein
VAQMPASLIFFELSRLPPRNQSKLSSVCLMEEGRR